MSTQYNPKLTSRELLQERVYKLLSELSYEGYNYEEVLMIMHSAGRFVEHELAHSQEASLRLARISADLAGMVLSTKEELLADKKASSEVDELNKLFQWDDNKKPN